jgi:1-acyl-sn-glycerol-3-phosphate acyltransferase
MRAALYCYFGKIKTVGREGIPKEGPLLFLPNHQNALLDALLIAVDGRRKPYFLTRSDVFSNALFRSFFAFFHMLPVYRFRDGRHTLKKNEEIFQRCAQLLCEGEAVVIFPEASHHLNRRVRPLSKGFTRILFQAVAACEKQDILLLPVGVNYLSAASFPDLTSLYYGQAFRLLPLYNAEDLRNSVVAIRNEVSEQLQTLTTHVPEGKNYDKLIAYLTSMGIDFQDPHIANRAIADLPDDSKIEPEKVKRTGPPDILRAIFYLINFPLLIPWFWIKKKKIPEPEFTSTFRFAYALLVYPVFYLLCFFLLGSTFGYAQTLSLIALHFACNQIYTKSVKTS